MSDEIEEVPTAVGEVVLVLNKREVLLDLGESGDGLEVGTRFAILGQKQVSVRGRDVTVTFPKTVVKIVRFEDGFAVGRTFRTIKGSSGYNFGLPSATPDTVELIDANNSARLELTADERKVQKGDTARETWGDEFIDEDERAF